MKFRKLAIIALSILLNATIISNKAFADDTVEVPAHSKDAIGNMLLQAVSLMGIPYRWGGNTPETGMDCSGFIRYVFKKSLGITLPRTADGMAHVGKRVSLREIEPGDLIFFNTKRGLNTHMGMYIGDNKFIQSPHTGSNIQISELNAFWRAKINGIKRIVQEEQNDDGDVTVEDYQEVRDEALPSGHIRSRRGHRHASHRVSHSRHSRHSTHHTKAKVSHSKKSHAKTHTHTTTHHKSRG